jgi:hypothetical protein
MNSRAPTLRATIKLHKTPMAIRPIINWRKAPAYPMATQLSNILKQYTQLPYTYNVKNSAHLMEELSKVDIHNNIRLCSFDITNMYTNIPTEDIGHIITMILNNNYIGIDNIYEIIHFTDIIFKRNYFEFNKIVYKQNEGLAMGAPTSAIIAEIYLQYIEHTSTQEILEKHKIVSFHRYVDDILILYDNTVTNVKHVLENFSNINNKLQFTMELESNNNLHYLDLNITRTNTTLTYNIFRKPTVTSTTLHNTSCHPYEHEKAAYKYLQDRVNSYIITPENKVIEENIIRQIAYENGYNNSITQKQNKNKTNNKMEIASEDNNQDGKNGLPLHTQAVKPNL